MGDLRGTMDREWEVTPHLPLSLARDVSSILDHLNGADLNKAEQSVKKKMKTLNEDLKIFQIKTKRALAF